MKTKKVSSSRFVPARTEQLFLGGLLLMIGATAVMIGAALSNPLEVLVPKLGLVGVAVFVVSYLGAARAWQSVSQTDPVPASSPPMIDDAVATGVAAARTTPLVILALVVSVAIAPAFGAVLGVGIGALGAALFVSTFKAATYERAREGVFLRPRALRWRARDIVFLPDAPGVPATEQTSERN